MSARYPKRQRRVVTYDLGIDRPSDSESSFDEPPLTDTDDSEEEAEYTDDEGYYSTEETNRNAIETIIVTTPMPYPVWLKTIPGLKNIDVQCFGILIRNIQADYVRSTASKFKKKINSYKSRGKEFIEAASYIRNAFIQRKNVWCVKIDVDKKTLIKSLLVINNYSIHPFEFDDDILERVIPGQSTVEKDIPHLLSKKPSAPILIPWKNVTPKNLHDTGDKAAVSLENCRRSRGDTNMMQSISKMVMPEERKKLLKQLFYDFWRKQDGEGQSFFMQDDVNMKEYIGVLTRLKELYTTSVKKQTYAIKTMTNTISQGDMRYSEWLRIHLGSEHVNFDAYQTLIYKFVRGWLAADTKTISQKLRTYDLTDDDVNAIIWLRGNAFTSELRNAQRIWCIKYTADPRIVFEKLHVLIRNEVIQKTRFKKDEPIPNIKSITRPSQPSSSTVDAFANMKHYANWLRSHGCPQSLITILTKSIIREHLKPPNEETHLPFEVLYRKHRFWCHNKDPRYTILIFFWNCLRRKHNSEHDKQFWYIFEDTDAKMAMEHLQSWYRITENLQPYHPSSEYQDVPELSHPENESEKTIAVASAVLPPPFIIDLLGNTRKRHSRFF